VASGAAQTSPEPTTERAPGYHKPVMAGRLADSDFLPVNDQRRVASMEMEQTANIPEIDDRFMGEWLEFGFREMRAYLDKHARFARYLDELETCA
jgi:hypothetical protein